MDTNRKFKVVVIDDQSKNLQLAAHVLNKYYDLILLNSGKKAMDLIKSKKPDLILLDIMMPEMSGYEVCEALKKDDDTKQIPIIFLTAKTTEEDIEKAYDVGGVDYVIKPFRPKELLARIQAHISLKNEMENNTRLNSDLKEVINQKDRLMSIIAHDLRGSAGQIDSLVNLLSYDMKKFAEQDKNIEIQLEALKKSSGHSRELLEDLLMWSRNQFGSISFTPEKLNAQEQTTKSISQISNLSKSKNISIINKVDENLELIVDKNMFLTVLRNLLSNSIKFSQEGKEITISSQPSKDGNMILVEDQGMGMSKDIIDKLFTPDKLKSMKGTKGEPGTGLGLNLCKEFMEKHDGTIEVESEEGKGSIFKLIFP